jgi:hypothetical protein
LYPKDVSNTDETIHPLKKSKGILQVTHKSRKEAALSQNPEVRSPSPNGKRLEQAV